MDPNAALAEFNATYQEYVQTAESWDLADELVETANNLFEWLAKGGFAPDWKVYK